METGFTGFSALRNADAMPEGAYVEDVWTTAKIAIDMSGMMDGNIVYMASYYNEELSKWLNVDKSNMPPTYTLSNKVYMVKLKDGTYAAVRLTNYMNASGVKGFMTIDYIYPFELFFIIIGCHINNITIIIPDISMAILAVVQTSST